MRKRIYGHVRPAKIQIRLRNAQSDLNLYLAHVGWSRMRSFFMPTSKTIRLRGNAARFETPLNKRVHDQRYTFRRCGFFALNSKYSQTCVKQAPVGKPKIGCLRQVLA